MFIKDQLSFIGFLSIQSEATVRGESGWHFKYNSAPYCDTGSKGPLSVTALTPFEQRNLRQLKMCLVQCAMSDCLAPFQASGITTFQAAILHIKQILACQCSSHISAISKRKTVSAVKQGNTVRAFCVRRPTLLKRVRPLQRGRSRTLSEM